jgi:hypothetical protein
MRKRMGANARAAIVAGAVAAAVSTPFAVAGDGDLMRSGKRNTATRETRIISTAETYTTRQSNSRSGDGGAATYGCRAAADREACLFVYNVRDGRAFDLRSKGAEAGRIMVFPPSGVSPDQVRPFSTNATGVATGLNADRVDGRNADELVLRSDLLRADVNANGTLARGTAGTTSSRPADGRYNVVFPRDVTGCTPLASVGSSGTGDPARAFIDVGLLPGNANGVRVELEQDTGGATNRPFHVIVAC